MSGHASSFVALLDVGQAAALLHAVRGRRGNIRLNLLCQLDLLLLFEKLLARVLVALLVPAQQRCLLRKSGVAERGGVAPNKCVVREKHERQASEVYEENVRARHRFVQAAEFQFCFLAVVYPVSE